MPVTPLTISQGQWMASHGDFDRVEAVSLHGIMLSPIEPVEDGDLAIRNREEVQLWLRGVHNACYLDLLFRSHDFRR